MDALPNARRRRFPEGRRGSHPLTLRSTSVSGPGPTAPPARGERGPGRLSQGEL